MIGYLTDENRIDIKPGFNGTVSSIQQVAREAGGLWTVRICDLKQKEIVNIKTCKRLGFIGDMDFDMETGCLPALIVPGPGCICDFLGWEKEYAISFCDICQVGNDIILVNIKEKDVTESIRC